MTKNNINMFAAVVIASVMVAANGATTPITTTINGVEWRFTLDEPNGAEGTAMIGLSTIETEATTDRDNDNLRGCSSSVSVDAGDIPWEFDYNDVHYKVTRIANSAFYKCTKMTGVLTIPPAVTTINAFAFQGCTGLTRLRGADGVTVIRKYAFHGCNNMEGTYPDLTGATYIGEGSFVNAPLTGALKLSNSLTTVKLLAFNACYFAGPAIMPSSVNTIGEAGSYGVFKQNRNLTAIWVKGKTSVPSDQTYSTVHCGTFASSCPEMKIILMGRNTKGGSMDKTGSNAMLAGDTGVQVFVPDNGFWNGLVLGGTDNKLWYYGPTNEFDLVVDDVLMRATFTPTTVDALTNSIAWAQSFKEHFDLDVRISVTNTLDIADATITQEMASGVTFDRLMFSAKTQAELTAILEKFPATTPISIDPAGMTERMVIPEQYTNVHVKAAPGTIIQQTARGLIILMR